MRMKGGKDSSGLVEAAVEDLNLGSLYLSQSGSLAAPSPGCGAQPSGWMVWGEPHPPSQSGVCDIQVPCQHWP